MLTRVEREIVIKQQIAYEDWKNHEGHEKQTEAGREHDFQT